MITPGTCEFFAQQEKLRNAESSTKPREDKVGKLREHIKLNGSEMRQARRREATAARVRQARAIAAFVRELCAVDLDTITRITGVSNKATLAIELEAFEITLVRLAQIELGEVNFGFYLDMLEMLCGWEDLDLAFMVAQDLFHTAITPAVGAVHDPAQLLNMTEVDPDSIVNQVKSPTIAAGYQKLLKELEGVTFGDKVNSKVLEEMRAKRMQFSEIVMSSSEEVTTGTEEAKADEPATGQVVNLATAAEEVTQAQAAATGKIEEPPKS